MPFFWSKENLPQTFLLYYNPDMRNIPARYFRLSDFTKLVLLVSKKYYK